MSINDQNYPVEITTTNVKVNDIQADLDFISLILDVNVSSKSSIEIDFDRKFIDSTFEGSDKKFIVLVDGDEPNFTEINTTSQSRTLYIELKSDDEEIEIICSIFGNSASTIPEPTPEPITDSITVRTSSSSFDEGDTIVIVGIRKRF